MATPAEDHYATLAEATEAANYWQQQATTDPLTGLPNRGILPRAWHFRVTAVALIDLNDFKRVNDTYGHDTGDALLIGVADRISVLLEQLTAVTVVRTGGDEFAILLESDPATAFEQCIMIHRIITGSCYMLPPEETGLDNPLHISVYASMGFTRVHPGGEQKLDGPHGPLARADRAMYRAKDSTNGGVTIYDPAKDQPGVRKIRRRNRDSISHGW